VLAAKAGDAAKTEAVTSVAEAPRVNFAARDSNNERLLLRGRDCIDTSSSSLISSKVDKDVRRLTGLRPKSLLRTLLVLLLLAMMPLDSDKDEEDSEERGENADAVLMKKSESSKDKRKASDFISRADISIQMLVTTSVNHRCFFSLACRKTPLTIMSGALLRRLQNLFKISQRNSVTDLLLLL
jgi:hypothetical protein